MTIHTIPSIGAICLLVRNLPIVATSFCKPLHHLIVLAVIHPETDPVNVLKEGEGVISVRRLKPLVTTGIRGLQEDSFPFRLYQKAKRLEVWNPAGIDADMMNFTARQLAA